MVTLNYLLYLISFWLSLHYGILITYRFLFYLCIPILYIASSLPTLHLSPSLALYFILLSLLAHLSIDNIEKRFLSVPHSEQLAIYWLWLAAPTQGVPHLRQEGGTGGGGGGEDGGGEESGCWGSVWTNWWAAWQFVNIRREQTNASVFPRARPHPRPLCLLFSSLLSLTPNSSPSHSHQRAHHIWHLSHVPRFICVSCVSLTSCANSPHTLAPRLSCISYLSHALSLSLSFAQASACHATFSTFNFESWFHCYL